MDAIFNRRLPGTTVRGSQLCVIVCGLHRSGTSAVTRLINLLGADIADDLLPSRPDNSRGYWESAAIVRVHDRLLKAVDVAHEDQFDPIPLRSDWLTSAPAQKAKRDLAAAIETEFADSRLFVVKDPRLSRLLPLWVELLAEREIAPVVVIPFRNPLEVAASLAQRNEIPLSKALLLYLFAYLETELASRQVPRLFVRYDSLLKDWRSFALHLSQISGGQLSAPGEGIAVEIDEFLSADLYHHRFSHDEMRRHPEVPGAIAEMFDRMNEAAKTGDESALRASFDCLRANTNDVAQLYRGYVLDARRQILRLRESFEGSTSWRITAPLRWIKKRTFANPARRPSGG